MARWLHTCSGAGEKSYPRCLEDRATGFFEGLALVYGRKEERKT